MGGGIKQMFNLMGSNPHHKETDKIMTDKIFNLLDQINREGIDNGTWGVAEGIDDTRSYFGTIENENLRGYKLIYIYMGAEEYFCFVKPESADLRMKVADDNELLIWFA